MKRKLGLVLAAVLFGTHLLADEDVSEVTLKKYLQLKGTLEMKLYVKGLGGGMELAAVIAGQNGTPIFCRPPKLALGVENYMSIIEEEVKAKRDSGAAVDPNTPIGVILISGFVNTFPCKQTKVK